jgi:hypothetical protein
VIVAAACLAAALPLVASTARGRRTSNNWRGLDEAPKRGWILADMKQDWKVIYPFQKP